MTHHVTAALRNLRSRAVAFASIAALALACPLGGQSLDAVQIQRIDSVFSRYNSASPGCALAIIRRDSIVYARGYGMASLELRVPITTRTVFDLGSVSKQFTAASIFLLQLDGKLNIDDDVRRYLPELPALGAKVTLRHLLTHTSGWRDYNDLLNVDGFDERDHSTDRDAWDALRRQRALNFTPGSTFRYSNTGYFLLSEVVKRVAGVSLAVFAHNRIFAPLGMTQTQFLDDTRRVIPDRATAYAPGDSGFVVEMANWDQLGDGAVQSNVEDLARWQANFQTGRVGGRRLGELLTTNGSLNGGTPIDYAAGLWAMTYHGASLIDHGGAWAGYRSSAMRLPDRQLSILITCNRADAALGPKGLTIAGILVPIAPTPVQSRPRSVPITGFFVSSTTGRSADVEQHGDTVLLDGAAMHVRDGAYADAVDAIRLDFTGGRVRITGFGDVVDTLQPVTRLTNVPRARLAEYVGGYVSTEVGTPYQVLSRGDTLFYRVSHGADVALSPFYVDAFISPNLPTMRFVRDKRGTVVALSFTGRGIHDLRLSRVRSTRQP